MKIKLRVLFQARPSLFRSPGGDTVQLVNTRRHLEDLGLRVDVDVAGVARPADYDIVHLFNLTRPQEIWLNMRAARDVRKPVCLSTIYWNTQDVENESRSRDSPLARAETVVRRAGRKLLGAIDRGRRFENRAESHVGEVGIRQMQEELVGGTSLFLPNSETEWSALVQDFPSAGGKLHVVVPNGVTPPGPRESDGRAQRSPVILPPDAVLCVGRIEPRKNQVRLLDALRATEIPVILVGRIADRAYARKVRRLLKRGDRMIGERGEAELSLLYARAGVHALPSLYETPGLVNLEAAAAGCNIVTGNVGTQREYFGNHAEYCDPKDQGSILSAVLRGLGKPRPNRTLQDHVLAHFTWHVAAERTVEAYYLLLETA